MTEAVAADTGDLEDFVAAGHRYLSRLEDLGARIRSAEAATVARIGGGPGSGWAPALTTVIDQAGATNRFVAGIGADLTSASGLASVSELRPGATDGPLERVDDGLRHRVAQAMEAGRSPADVGLAEVHFPPAYVELVALDRRIADLAGRGVGQRHLGAGTAHDLRQLRERRDQVARSIGASRSGHMSDVEAVAAVAEWTDGFEWAGRRYADWVSSARADATHVEEGSGGPGDQHEWLIDVSHRGDEDELLYIGRELERSAVSAVAFYNEMGAEGTAALATLIGEHFPDLDQHEDRNEAFARFARGLAGASRVDVEVRRARRRPRSGSPDESPANTVTVPALAFSGADLIEAPTVSGHHRVGVYHPTVLLADGRFDPRFLAGATTATLLAVEDDALAASSFRWHQLGHRDITITPAGEDPRNIVLARGADDPATAALVVEQLAGRPSGLDPLLAPRMPYRPAGDGRGEDHPDRWMLPEFHVPDLGGSEPGAEGPRSPITSFLISAGVDERAARTVLAAVADPSTSGLSPAVAGGVDGIMAQHATLLYPNEVLAAVGIERTGINDGDGDPITADQWRKVHGRVLASGHGAGLAAGTEILLHRAIVNATNGATFDARAVKPFATIAAATDSEAIEARINLARRADDDARRTNRLVNGSIGGGLAFVGLIPPLSAPAAGTSFAFSTLYEGSGTDNERNVLRQEFDDLRYGGQDRQRVWGRLIYRRMVEHAASGTGLELMVPGRSAPTRVEVRELDGRPRWRHPTSGSWHDLPAFGTDDQRRLFVGTSTAMATAARAELNDAYLDGLLFTADDPEAVAEARRRLVVDDGGDDMGRVDSREDRMANEAIESWIHDG